MNSIVDLCHPRSLFPTRQQRQQDAEAKCQCPAIKYSREKNHDMLLFLCQQHCWSSHWAGRNNKQLKLAPTRFDKRQLPGKHYPGGTFIETESPTISRPEISRCWWTKGRHSPAVKSHLGGCFSQYFSLFLLVIYLCGNFCICSQ